MGRSRKAEHEPRALAPSRFERYAAGALVAFAFALFLTYSVVTPVFEASDELWHYPFVQHLATGGGLPVQRPSQTDLEDPWRQEGSQPPLYYAAAALATAPINQTDWRALRRLNVHSDMGVPTRDGNANAILHSAREAFPWSGAALAVHVARLVSVLMSTVTVLGAYLIACELFRGGTLLDVTTRLLAPVFSAGVPMFAFISGSINNDNAAVMFSTVGVWWALRLVRTRTLTLRHAVIAGLLSAAGALSKASALGLLGIFGLAAVLAALPERPRPAGWVKEAVFRVMRYGAVMVSVAVVLAGWWFYRNYSLYGDPLGWSAFLDAVGRRVPPASLSQLWSEREGFVLAYWGVFGTLNVVMPEWVYYGLHAMMVAGLIGLLLTGLARLRHHTAISPLAQRQLVLCAAWIVIIFVAFLRWTTLTPASQGRLLFPCIAVVGSAVAYGLGRLHRAVLITASVALAALAWSVPFLIIAPAYAPPAQGWTQRLPVALNADFGSQLELAEASAMTGDTAHPGESLEVRLNWRVSGRPERNYSVFVHAVDENEVIIAQRDMHPGQGRLATAELAPGREWTDTYALRLSPLAPVPRRLHFRVGVYEAATGQRMKLPDGREWVEFGSVPLEAAGAAASLLRYEHGPELVAYAFSPPAAAPGETLRITTTWQAARVPRDDYTLSLQLLDERAQKIAQQDVGQPAAAWKAGEAREIVATLTLRPDAPPGVYSLLIVWYRPSPGFPRSGAYDARGQYAGDQIELARVRVR